MVMMGGGGDDDDDDDEGRKMMMMMMMKLRINLTSITCSSITIAHPSGLQRAEMRGVAMVDDITSKHPSLVFGKTFDRLVSTYLYQQGGDGGVERSVNRGDDGVLRRC